MFVPAVYTDDGKPISGSIFEPVATVTSLNRLKLPTDL